MQTETSTRTLKRKKKKIEPPFFGLHPFTNQAAKAFSILHLPLCRADHARQSNSSTSPTARRYLRHTAVNSWEERTSTTSNVDEKRRAPRTNVHVCSQNVVLALFIPYLLPRTRLYRGCTRKSSLLQIHEQAAACDDRPDASGNQEPSGHYCSLSVSHQKP